MRELGWITEPRESSLLLSKKLNGSATSWQTSELPYITEAVVAELNERFVGMRC
jgi:hypothetical protein